MAGDDLHKKLDELLLLPRGWDSYGAEPVSRLAVTAAKALLDGLVAVPCAHGGVQMETHAAGYDVQIEFGPDGRIRSFSLTEA